MYALIMSECVCKQCVRVFFSPDSWTVVVALCGLMIWGLQLCVCAHMFMCMEGHMIDDFSKKSLSGLWDR